MDYRDRALMSHPRHIEVTYPSGERAVFYGDTLRVLSFTSGNVRRREYWDAKRNYLGASATPCK